jgi:hypothetical protein
MQPIAEWLANIGVERCTPAFADNDIDVSVLPDLPDAELLAAVADTITEPKRRETAERLQLTDMLFEIHKSPLSGFRGDTVPIGAGEPAEGERMTRIMKGSEMLGASAINLCPVLQQFGVLVVGRPSRLDAALEKYGPRRHPGRDQSSLTR